MGSEEGEDERLRTAALKNVTLPHIHIHQEFII